MGTKIKCFSTSTKKYSIGNTTILVTENNTKNQAFTKKMLTEGYTVFIIYAEETIDGQKLLLEGLRFKKVGAGEYNYIPVLRKVNTTNFLINLNNMQLVQPRKKENTMYFRVESE